MGKIIEGLFGKNGLSRKYLKNFFKKKQSSRTVCYILMTCNESSKDGKMNVEMKYEGDQYLASYMIETASTIIKRD